MFNKSRSKFNETINNTLQQPIRENSCANNKRISRGAVLSVGVGVVAYGLMGLNPSGAHNGSSGTNSHCFFDGAGSCASIQGTKIAIPGPISGMHFSSNMYYVDSMTLYTMGFTGLRFSPMPSVVHFHGKANQIVPVLSGTLMGGNATGAATGRTASCYFLVGDTGSISSIVKSWAVSRETGDCGWPGYPVKPGSPVPAGRALPGNIQFAAPSLADVILASKGSKNTINLGNSGFAPIGNGSLIGVGYDRADNSLRNHGEDYDYSGNEYRVHLDYLKGQDNMFYGLAGEYRKGKFTLDSSGDKYETEYYGPRVDVGWKGMNSWAQLSGAYLWGNAKFDDEKGNGHLIQAGFLAQMDKPLGHRLTLEPGVDVQYIWQKLGTIGDDTIKNRDYGRADFNVGLGVALMRGWSVTPNVGYRWDIQAACTQVDGADKFCEPTASGVRYGVQLAKAIMVTGSKWDHLALSAYYDYFKKSGTKQTMWGVLAQYPF